VVPDLLLRFPAGTRTPPRRNGEFPAAIGYDTNLSQPKNRNPAITGEDAVVEKKRKISKGIKVSSIW
jgi:hypothetical protein